jgi:hypothetical protein
VEGRCHCGACRIRLARKPDDVARCNCSLCRATGWRGVYLASDEVEISGEFDSYVRSDLDPPMLGVFRCRNCGTPTHWEPLTEPPHERMGINANLLDPSVLQGLPVRKVDGASW